MTTDTAINIVGALIVFVFGASIGSFLNVVAYRLPLGRSLIRPGSACPHCGTPIPWYALLPVLGYFLLLGACVKCKSRISPRYPIVEALTGFLTLIVVFRYATPLEIAANLGGNSYSISPSMENLRFQIYGDIMTGLWILYTGMALSLIDLDHQILPDVITLPGTIVGILLGSLNPALGFWQSCLGAAVGAGGIFIVAKSYELIRNREGLGFGDVKYLGFIGAVVGWQGVVWVIAIASVVGALVGIAIIFLRKKTLTLAIPFGPFLALAAFVITLWGESIRLFVYPPPM